MSTQTEASINELVDVDRMILSRVEKLEQHPSILNL
eukprot:CAMPEP_0194531412 /NCGR_PEP_ID=MMETSP0253-20130528/68705_1 /TAXON_ID=2966 /ORGANISM="Noctiluca scintillans" /LENGTH=35 /DNA_ID= /DNA_START= /DNA_END= /DNA_ORIENTATION=